MVSKRLDRSVAWANGLKLTRIRIVTAGDVSHNTAALIPPLLEDGIRFLIYAGESLAVCKT